MTAAGPTFDATLKRKTWSSIAWTIGRSASDQIFSFIVFLILARLLSKADIGLFAIAFVFAEVGRIIATNGLTQIIARASSIPQRFVSTIFWMNLGAALAYVGLMLALAPVLADWLDQPQLVNILRLLSVAVVINAIGATHMALRLREFGHKTIALRSLLAGLIGGGAAVAAALNGFGVWSLVVQRLITETIGAILSWTAYRWRPSAEFDARQAADNLRFGGNLTIAQLISLFIVRIQDILIGFAMGPVAVGVYRVAWRCAEIFGIGAIQPFSTVALQTFSRVRDNPEALRHAYRSLLALCALVSFPVLVGFGILSDRLIVLMFGDKWQESGQLGHIFAFMAVPFTLNYFASPALSAMGDSGKQRTLAIVQLTSTVLITWLMLPWGLWWVAAGYVFRAYLTLPLQIVFLRSSAGIGLRDTLRAIWPAFGASTLMGGLLWLVLWAWNPSDIFMLAALIGGSALVYALAVLALSSKLRTQVRHFFRRDRLAG